MTQYDPILITFVDGSTLEGKYYWSYTDYLAVLALNDIGVEVLQEINHSWILAITKIGQSK